MPLVPVHIKYVTMEKTTMKWTIAATFTAAAAITLYCLQQRKKDKVHSQNHKKSKHLTPVFAQAKEHVAGEFTL
jgi:hypothetical protein